MNLCPADPALRACECKAFYVFKVNHFENKDLSTMMSVCLSLPQMHPNAILNFCLTFVVHYGHLQVFYNFMLLWSSLLSVILYLSISLPILFYLSIYIQKVHAKNTTHLRSFGLASMRAKKVFAHFEQLSRLILGPYCNIC